MEKNFNLNEWVGKGEKNLLKEGFQSPMITIKAWKEIGKAYFKWLKMEDGPERDRLKEAILREMFAPLKDTKGFDEFDL